MNKIECDRCHGSFKWSIMKALYRKNGQVTVSTLQRHLNTNELEQEVATLPAMVVCSECLKPSEIINLYHDKGVYNEYGES